jgi:hypothetical protein
MFRTVNYRTYELVEDDNLMTRSKVRISHPNKIPNWTDLKPGYDYTKLDDNGIIREGEYCDENTILVGGYLITGMGDIKDNSLTPQVWTRGRVERVVVLYDNRGYKTVKIRVTQDRVPELGDKFSNRHGQKGTIGVLLRDYDMPRTADGIVPDMIMNPHAIPSRMTIGQNLEQLFGKASALAGAIGDGTAFMNDGSPEEQIGYLLEQHGYEKYGNEVLYNGATGHQLPVSIFIGPVYGMRLKHMVEDKWQARGKGRKEQMTHQPTGGRGNQGGLKIGEMDRDAIVGHSIAGFFRESFMLRSDGSSMTICSSCGTIPVINKQTGVQICPMCDGPVKFIGNTPEALQLMPAGFKTKGKFFDVEIPYSTKLLADEMSALMNIGMRFITSGDIGGLTSYEKQIDIDTGGVGGGGGGFVKVVEKEFGGENPVAIEVAGFISDSGDQAVSKEMVEQANDANADELVRLLTRADVEDTEGTGTGGTEGTGMDGTEGMGTGTSGTEGTGMDGTEGMNAGIGAGTGMIGGGVGVVPISGAGQFDSRFIPQPFRGAPPVITVDTSSEAMASDGLLGPSNANRMRRYGGGGGGGMGGAGGGGMGGGMGGAGGGGMGGGMGGGGYVPGRVEGSGQDAIVLKPSAPIFVNKLG